MVEFTTEKIIVGERRHRLARTCLKCKRVRWLIEFDNLYAGRCMECTTKLLQESHCRNCGVQTEPIRNRWPMYYCKASECQQARFRMTTGTAHAATRRKFAGRTTKQCPVCTRRFALTEEHFSISRRNPDGSVKYFYAYCRACENADKRSRYQASPKRQADLRKRAAAQRERLLERRRNDPQFDAEFKRKRNALNRAYRERRRQREQPRGPVPSSGRGPEVPAYPLMVAIEKWMEREELSAEAAAETLGTSPRRFWDWRQGGNTRLSIADKALVAMDLLWFDVWQPCLKEHEPDEDEDCQACAEYKLVEQVWEGE